VTLAHHYGADSADFAAEIATACDDWLTSGGASGREGCVSL
jgi:hypothetical protein